MSKPIDFWIVDFKSGKRQVYEKPVQYDQEFFPPPDYGKAVLPDKITHCREVVPIDWSRIWIQYETQKWNQLKKHVEDGEPYMVPFKDKIQELVEKALAGEE